MTVPVQTLVADALSELNVYQAGDSISAADGQYTLGALNRIFDLWNATRQAVWCSIFSPFVLVPSLQPHTIGPTGTWVMTERPVSIEGLSYVFPSGTTQRITVHTDPQWWLAQIPLAGGTPFGAYYEPDIPNGRIYFSSIPSAADTVIVLVRRRLAQVLLTDLIDLPQGYQQAVTLTLMEAIADTFGRTVSPKKEHLAAQARGIVFANNVVVPTLDTRAAGLGSNLVGRWDYRTGTWR